MDYLVVMAVLFVVGLCGYVVGYHHGHSKASAVFAKLIKEKLG